MTIGFPEGQCRLCGSVDHLNEGVCARHTAGEAQAYLFGLGDGRSSGDRALAQVKQQAQLERESAAAIIREVTKDREDLRVKLSQLQEKYAELRGELAAAEQANTN
jgi:hypothetical protein